MSLEGILKSVNPKDIKYVKALYEEYKTRGYEILKESDMFREWRLQSMAKKYAIQRLNHYVNEHYRR